MGFNTEQFLIVSNTARGNKSVREFSYLCKDGDTADSIINNHSYFINAPIDFLLNDIIKIVETSPFIISVVYVKTKTNEGNKNLVLEKVSEGGGVTPDYVIEKVNEEKERAQLVETQLRDLIDGLQLALDEEKQRAIESEEQLQTEIDGDISFSNITGEPTDNEKLAILFNEKATVQDLSIEKTARFDGDNTIMQALQVETQTRITADGQLTTSITNLNNDINTVQQNLDNEVNARVISINNEQQARTTADTTLQTNIDNETSERTTADNVLQTNIDNITISTLSDDLIQLEDAELFINDLLTTTELKDTSDNTLSIQSLIDRIVALENK
jgi:hypothetical protein